jgi:hypothetical protein
VEWVEGADQERVQREEREHVHRDGHRHCQHGGDGADVRLVADVVRAATCKPAPVAAIEPKISM